MYQYVGFGLLSLAAILMIPAQDVESFTNPSMYGMAILTVYDSTGNTLLTNTVHNEVLDVGTARMLANMFTDGGAIVGAIEADQADGICLTDAIAFDADGNDDMTSATFSTTGGGGTNGLDMSWGSVPSEWQHR